MGFTECYILVPIYKLCILGKTKENNNTGEVQPQLCVVKSHCSNVNIMSDRLTSDDLQQIDIDLLAKVVNYQGINLLQKFVQSSSSTYSSKLHEGPSTSSSDSQFNLCQKVLNHPSIHVLALRRREEEKQSSSRSRKSAESPLKSAFQTNLFQFVVNNACKLFDKLPESRELSTEQLDNVYSCAAVPPFNRFLRLTKSEKSEKFFEDVRVGDVLCGRVKSTDESGIMVRLLCSVGRMQRDLEALELEVYIAVEELLLSNESSETDTIKDTVTNEYNRNQLLKAMVLTVFRDTRKLNLGMKSVPADGTIAQEQLPTYFVASNNYHDQPFDRCVRRAAGFRNPTVSTILCSDLNLPDSRQYWNISLLPHINSPRKFAKRGCTAEELRKVQTNKLAMKSVVKGIEKVRSGHNTEALQHLNKALSLEENNVEALVARGALYANKESFESAICDLEAALTTDPLHPNAKSYLIETLMAQARVMEAEQLKGRKAEKRTRKLIKMCQRIVELQPKHPEALFRLLKLDPHHNEKGERKRRRSHSAQSVDDSDDSAEAKTDLTRQTTSRKSSENEEDISIIENPSSSFLQCGDHPSRLRQYKDDSLSHKKNAAASIRLSSDSDNDKHHLKLNSRKKNRSSAPMEKRFYSSKYSSHSASKKVPVRNQTVISRNGTGHERRKSYGQLDKKLSKMEDFISQLKMKPK